MKILDGKHIAAGLRAQLARDIQSSGITPGLAAILIGDDPASQIYVDLKEKAALEVGMLFHKHTLASDTTTSDIISLISTLNEESRIHGVLVQLPLPQHIDTHQVIRTIDPRKDADGFHPDNITLLNQGTPRVISPPHAGILRLLDETGVDFSGKHAVLLTNSHEFADPIASLLIRRDMRVTTLVKSADYHAHTRDADVLIVAVGKAHLIAASDIKPRATIIDVGTNRLAGGRVVGDVNFKSVKDKAAFITPVPGGVGPMTVVYLLKNTFELAQRLV